MKEASDELERRIQAATSDIAHQNELLRRQAIELEQASALKSQFLANMSHEFRTPLNAMLGYTSMLLQGVGGPLEPNARGHLARVESNGRHLLTIINEILDISRIEAGRMPLQVSRFKVPDLVAEVKSELEPIILRSKLDGHHRPAEGPAGDGQRSAEGEADSAEPAEQRVEVHASRQHHHQRPAKQPATARSPCRWPTPASASHRLDQEKIFEDFRQLDNSPTRAYGGTGLGLVDLPAAGSDARRPYHAAQRNGEGFDLHPGAAYQGAEMTANSERPRVLVVDDYPDAREMYAEYLQFSGFDVIEAGNGMEAIERAADSAPDIILMDLSLPVMDGWEATRRLKADKATADIPIVALTGHALAGILEGAKKAGCDAFVTKPCLPEDLVKEIRKVLSAPSAQARKARRSGKYAKTNG